LAVHIATSSKLGTEPLTRQLRDFPDRDRGAGRAVTVYRA
jgi:hypothetical protein